MSQLEIFDFLLKESPNKFSARELMYKLNLAEQIVFGNLKRLLNHKEIQKSKGKYWIE